VSSSGSIVRVPIRPVLSIVVPALDEADNLPALVSRMDRALAGCGLSYEVLVVDDESTDDTADVARELGRRYPVLLVTRQGSSGKGHALVEGFRRCRGEIVCMIDADLQYPPEAIPAMVALVRAGRADIVVGDRIRHHTSLLRRFVSRGGYLVIQAVHGLGVDVQSGLKVIRGAVLDQVEIRPSAWALDVELLVRARSAGYVIEGHGVELAARRHGHTKLRLPQATWQILSTSVALKFAARRHGHTKLRLPQATWQILSTSVAVKLAEPAVLEPWLAVLPSIVDKLGIPRPGRPASVRSPSQPAPFGGGRGQPHATDAELCPYSRPLVMSRSSVRFRQTPAARSCRRCRRGSGPSSLSPSALCRGTGTAVSSRRGHGCPRAVDCPGHAAPSLLEPA
jgi:dolichol-phosphate mannosyltransferase